MKCILITVFFGVVAAVTCLVLFVCSSVKKDTSALVNYVEAGDLVSASKCLKAGADINGFRLEGWSGHKHDGTTPLVVAINSDSLIAVKWVIANGADVNKKPNGSGHPIVMAAINGNIAIIQELEKSEVNFDITYLDIKLSDWASRTGHDEDFVKHIQDR